LQQEPPESTQEVAKSTFDAGDLVDALWTANGGWYMAKVVSRNPDGSYEVEWKDGTNKDRIKAADEVRPCNGENLSAAACTFIEATVKLVEDVLVTHKAVPPEQYTCDAMYRSLVSEMLDSKAHALACLRYTPSRTTSAGSVMSPALDCRRGTASTSAFCSGVSTSRRSW
jgi:hypothetical protein